MAINPKPFTLYPKRLNQGFTLIETLIVIGLFAAIAAFGMIIGTDSISRSTVYNERDNVVLFLTAARARAVTNVNESAHGVRIDSDEIIAFELVHGIGHEENVRSSVRNQMITVSPNPTTVIFSQLSARANLEQTITLSDGTKSADIVINSEGRIEW